MTPTSQMGTLTIAQMIKQQTTRNDGPHLSPRAPVSFSVADAWTHVPVFYAVEQGRKHIAERKEKVYNTSLAMMTTSFHSGSVFQAVVIVFTVPHIFLTIQFTKTFSDFNTRQAHK